MSGLATLCKAGPLIETSRGRRLHMKGRTLRHLGEAEAQVLSLRGDVMHYASVTTSHIKDKEDRKKAIIAILRKCRSRWIGCLDSDIRQFYSTLEGRIFSFWQAIRDEGLSYQECEDIYCEEADLNPDWEHRVKYAVDIATGDAGICRMHTIFGLRKAEDDDSEGMQYTREQYTLFAFLFKEPFNFLPDQVADLTLGQISLIVTSTNIGEDINAERRLFSQHANAGMRMMRSKYNQAYELMADNMVDGLPAMSGLIL